MKYNEKLKDISIIQLNVEGFNELKEKEKRLVYHLSEAGLYGNLIALDQGSKYNLELIENLIKIYKYNKENEMIKNSLFILFANRGIYDILSGERIELPLIEEELNKLGEELEIKESCEKVKEIWFKKEIKNYRTVQKEGIDVIKESGVNFYEDLTYEEVKKYREEKKNIEEKGNNLPPYGFNEKLSKENEVIKSEIIKESGLYGSYISNIKYHLNEGLKYVENENQKESISSLIKFYETGDVNDFDRHCISWTNDKDSNIYYINGLIESYEDPLGVCCTFESVVGFKNPLQTEKVNKIIKDIQWFEDNLPFDKKYKKESAKGLSASSITVISMAGKTSPSLPLGINLPNSDWIRKEHGSKSVNLENVSQSRNESEKELIKKLYLSEYSDIIEKYLGMTNSLHTDLHEVVGHGSGKVLEGSNSDNLGIYYSTIEEARADLVALYYIGDNKLKEIGVYEKDVNIKDVMKAQYIGYITNGAISQLRKIKLGSELKQAHFRNRQLISLWLLEKGDKEKINLIKENGNYVIKLNDENYVREMIGKLLSEVQEIKSTGDFERAKNLVMRYGTKINEDIHIELLNRIEELKLPKIVGFITPLLKEVENKIEIIQDENFIENQIKIFDKCNEEVYKNVKKIKNKY